MSISGTTSTGTSTSSTTPLPVDISAVLYTLQSLTNAQQLQARTNIGAIAKDAIENNIVDVSFNEIERLLRFTFANRNAISIDISSHTGLNNILLNEDKDLQISYLDGSQSVIEIGHLFSDSVKSVNGKTGSNIRIEIEDIRNLPEALNNRTSSLFTSEFEEIIVTRNDELVEIGPTRITLLNFVNSFPAGTQVSTPSTPGAELIMRREVKADDKIEIGMSYLKNGTPSEIFELKEGSEARFILDHVELKWVLVQYHNCL